MSNLRGKRVAIYARFSSDSQREASIEDQVRRCVDYIKAQGGTVEDSLVFTDAAISGSTTARPSFERLMSLVNTKPAKVDAIITEDMSRISRDFADSAFIFKRLQFAKVALLGVADGIDTSAKGAKMAFTLKSLMSDLYLDDLRDKTLRGLEGRALAGMSTGSLPYGYRSIPVADGYGKTTGYRIEIDETKANVIRWVFAEYLRGGSLTSIAHELHRQNIETPRAKTRHRKQGWVDGSVRAILHNEKYAGVWRFKTRQWVRDPSTNTRKPIERPESEHVVTERPELAIITGDTWQAVRARLASVREFYTSKREGRAVPQGRTTFPFSSLLLCGACGQPMVISGAGVGYYRCSHYVKRRTCVNCHSVREDETRERILAEVRDRLTRPKALDAMRKVFAEQLGELNRERSKDLKERQARLARTEQRIKGLVGFLGDGDRSEAVVSGLRDLEAQAKQERAAIAAIERDAEAPVALPMPADVRAAVEELERAVDGDPVQAREALRQLFGGEGITMTPQPDGSYLASAKLFPLALRVPPPDKKRAVHTALDHVNGRSSGGRI